ncbi:MAG: D-alanine--D-alanine ligase [Candidatus Pacebacteria bacterium]|nr:D-alanine--D-alanine ligase [Candidatus Paceibacterota bacterium]
MNGTVVGVLRGGPSREHDVSLLTGHAVVANLPRDRYTVRDIYIDKKGIWHERGKPSTPVDILRSVDVVVNALHGEYGEDGEVQKLLERFGVPYTGSDSLTSYFTMHKAFAKERAKQIGLKTPKYQLVEPGQDLESIAIDITRRFSQPVVIKPLRAGSSIGISIVSGYAPIYRALSQLSESSNDVLVEEYIRGVEATAGIVEGLRGEELYALPPIEIIPPRQDFFSYEVKSNGTSHEVCPGRFSRSVTQELQDAARDIHRALDLRHYSRSDFIVAPSGVYYLETNTLPGLSKQALLPKSLHAVGVPFPDFLAHVVDLALQK